MLAGPFRLIRDSRQNRSVTIKNRQRHTIGQGGLGSELRDPFNIEGGNEGVLNGAGIIWQRISKQQRPALPITEQLKIANDEVLSFKDAPAQRTLHQIN